MISVHDVQVYSGKFKLECVSFRVRRGSYAILMGRTGCGKTTMLEAICGLRVVRAGRILLDETEVTHLKPAQRGIGYVPQDGALFNTMTIAAHLAFALRVRKWPPREIDARVEELAELLGITHLLGRRPPGLSGGERQRVALGRALSYRPRVLCLDEPLSALDDETRHQMYRLLKRVQEHEQVTALHVTHNREDADHLGDTLLRMEDGLISERSLERDAPHAAHTASPSRSPVSPIIVERTPEDQPARMRSAHEREA